MRGFVNDISSGSIPHLDLLLASRLIAIEKPHGGVRAIAMGEVFLVCTCALSHVPTTADLLAPPLVRDLIRDDPRSGIRVMQVHAAAPCQH